jgi:hypothetical protein
VGPPPESTTPLSSHNPKSVIIITGLPFNLTDHQLKKQLLETVAVRPKFIYMHVMDVKSGMFSGTAILECQDEESANRIIKSGVDRCQVRFVDQQEFASLAGGEWPMLEYGPPQGVYAQTTVTHVAAPVPVWAQPGRAPVSNPWKK